MTNYLVQQATQNIWCEPAEDNQYFIAPARLTVNGGASKYAEVIWTAVDLPNAFNSADRSYYHVYQIGKLDPVIFSVSLNNTWQPIEALGNSNSCVIDLFLDNGAIIPRANGWLRQTENGNVLLCVLVQPLLDLGTFNLTIGPNTVTRPVTLDTNVLYIHFYKDAVIDNPGYLPSLDNPTVLIRSIHADITNANSLSAFLGQVDAIESGYPHGVKGLFQIGGFVVSRPVAWSQTYAGVRFTYTMDETMVRSIVYPLTGCPTFVSTLDAGKSKYILLADNTYNGIDHFGDLDFYLIATSPDGSWRGVFLNRADPTSVRMLTHNAYAVSTQLITAYQNENIFLNSGLPLSILTRVRKPGQAHPPSHVYSKLHELYKLSRDQILQAMSGIDSTVPEWEAASLESSPYTALMSTSFTGVTLEVAEATYGYNAICKLMNDTPVAITNPGESTLQFPATPALLIPDVTTGNGMRTYWGYDSNGLLVGWGNDTSTNDVVTLSSQLAGTTVVEAFQASTSATLDGVVMGNADMHDPRLAQYGFRVYACTISDGIPTESWADVTGTSFYTYYPNGNDMSDLPTIAFNAPLISTDNLYMAIKLGGHILAFDVPLQTIDWPGFIRFSIDSTVVWNGASVSRPQSIPAGIVDVFMGLPGGNYTSLIRDVDYYMQWPQIVIVKRPPNGAIPKVLVRAYGFCEGMVNLPYPARETGWVSGGVLSVDSQYEVRDDRPLRIVSNGKLYTRDQVQFAEATGGPLLTDGKPYAISDYWQQLEPFTTVDTMSYRESARDIDDRVGNYLTARLQTTIPPNPLIVNAKWDVYSPFLAAIIAAFNFSFLSNGELSRPYTNLDVAGWVAPWTYLLDYDPCVVGVDLHFIEIYPHMYFQSVAVTSAQYAFLNYLIANYLNNKTSLSEAVTIQG